LIPIGVLKKNIQPAYNSNQEPVLIGKAASYLAGVLQLIRSERWT